MYPRSARFDQAVRYGDAEVVTTIDAYRGGELVAANVPWVMPSSVTVDEGASSWRSCEVTVAATSASLVPTSPSAALSPYGTDLYIQTGFRYPESGVLEQVPMGVFRILLGRPTSKGLIALQGYDYSRVVARARFEVPRVFARGFSRSLAIATLISERTVGAGPVGHSILSYNLADDHPLPLTVFEEGERYGDPWKACMDLADAAGQQVFFYPSGPFPLAVLRPLPALTDPLVWTFKAGRGETMVDMRPEQDTTVGYNVYVVTGESGDLGADGINPVRASAEVTDPSSPIYPATYGRVPTFLASSFIKTQQQAQQVADANLPLKAGGSERLTIVAFPHPAHEAGDAVQALYPYLGIDSSWILSRFSMPLNLGGNVDYTCRAKRVA